MIHIYDISKCLLLAGDLPKDLFQESIGGSKNTFVSPKKEKPQQK